MNTTINPPPSVDYAPTEIQNQLISMQQLTIDELLKIAQSQIPQSQQEIHIELLEKNQNNQLSDSDKILLQSLRINADHLMIKKAYAWSLLKWHDYQIPNLNQLL
jgi:hypothetical protein